MMMKILTSGLIAASLGLSWLATSNESSVAADGTDCRPACLEDCDATVERISDDACRIECTNENGESCWVVVSCDPTGRCEVLDRGGDCERPICNPADCPFASEATASPAILTESGCDQVKASECAACDDTACDSMDNSL